MDGNMAVDDVAVGLRYMEFVHDHVDNLFVVAHTEIVAFLFLVGFLLGKEIAFEGRHLGFVEEGTVRSAP